MLLHTGTDWVLRKVFGIRARMLRRRVVYNVCDAPPGWPKALLHYKTEPLFNPLLVRRYVHTNNWEIVEICKILHHAGFQVDVVDRSEREWLPEDEYSLLIGSGSGRAGWRYPYYASKTPSALRVLYATSSEAQRVKAQVLARYEAFETRTGIRASPMRVPYDVDIEGIMSLTDTIVCTDVNGYSSGSYERFNLPVYSIVPSTSPAVRFDPAWTASRSSRSFLCFSGNGFIAKGVDLVVEAFAKMPDLTLHIAGPKDDVAFWEAYAGVIESCPNIAYEGFLDVRGRKFNELCGECSFVILPSSAEGACTSVATAMRAGLVPITTYETGMDDGGTGFLLPSDTNELIRAIVETASRVAQMNRNDYWRRVGATRQASAMFSQAGFAAIFSQALFDVLSNRK